jgi:hypothetical protein
VVVLAGNVFSGMDVNIAHAGKDQAIVAEDMLRRPQARADGRDDAVLDTHLTGTHAVNVCQSSFNDNPAHE